MNGWVALIVAVTGLLGAVGGLIALFLKVKEVHVLVNSQSKEMTKRIDQLQGVLQGAGLAVPDRLNGEPGSLPVP
jgi:hypothetical protein